MNNNLVYGIEDVEQFWKKEENLKSVTEISFEYAMFGLRKAGTENYRARAMGDLPGRSATLDWDSRCNKDMRRWGRTRAILQAERMRAGLWDIRRRWRTLATAESMR